MSHVVTRFVFISVLLASFSSAETTPRVIPLWENGAPGFESLKNEPELAQSYWVRNINNPSLTVFLPPEGKGNGCAVVVAPGGGFRELVYNAEGKQAAEFLNSLGIAAFVLKYRLPNEEKSPYHFDDVKRDAYRAMRLVRSRASEFHIDAQRVGMLGFSAGGAVVMMVAYDKGDGDPKAVDLVDRANGRPDFAMMVYPGGKVPQKIPADSPPTFLLCANDDEYHCDEVTMELVQKYRAANVPVELHLLARGKHAFNMGDRSTFAAVKHWPDRMAEWLGDSGYLKARVTQ